ncbi:hypothetical protein [Blastococcus mobilis]|uniref:Uncharacterized protein n=1 Tax=Blastococcus mobilis TaxID=1938746 RepID=A0A238VEN0_9ACTN|nr:hypothetical protein [Blastococcus mobilis]SNR32860.1 hypothetical protein SAMN06272737_10361 [Blastococcus mobilis]
MSIDPNWKPDPVKVAALIADHEADVAAQELIVEKLRDLVDDEERELTRRQRRVEEIREAWARHGVEVPDGLRGALGASS